MGLFGKKKEKGELSFGFPASERGGEEALPGILPPPPGIGEKPKAMEEPEPIMEPELPERPPELRAPAISRRVERPPMETVPEEIMPPREPVIRELRPHVFLKIDKYKEVMMSIDKMAAQIKDLSKSLENLKDIEERELLKIKDTESTLIELNNIAANFDKIFSNPAK